MSDDDDKKKTFEPRINFIYYSIEKQKITHPETEKNLEETETSSTISITKHWKIFPQTFHMHLHRLVCDKKTNFSLTANLKAFP